MNQKQKYKNKMSTLERLVRNGDYDGAEYELKKTKKRANGHFFSTLTMSLLFYHFFLGLETKGAWALIYLAASIILPLLINAIAHIPPKRKDSLASQQSASKADIKAALKKKFERTSAIGWSPIIPIITTVISFFIGFKVIEFDSTFDSQDFWGYVFLFAVIGIGHFATSWFFEYRLVAKLFKVDTEDYDKAKSKCIELLTPPVTYTAKSTTEEKSPGLGAASYCPYFDHGVCRYYTGHYTVQHCDHMYRAESCGAFRNTLNSDK